MVEVTAPDDDDEVTAWRVISPIDGPVVVGRCDHVSPPSLAAVQPADGPDPGATPQCIPVACAVGGTSLLWVQTCFASSNCQDWHTDGPAAAQLCMHAAYVVPCVVVAFLPPARAQSVHPPIGMLSMKLASTASEVGLLTFNVSAIAGYAEAFKLPGLVERGLGG